MTRTFDRPMNAFELISEKRAAKLGLKRATVGVLAVSLTVNFALSLTVLLRDQTVTTVLLPMSALTHESPMTLSNQQVSNDYLLLVARDFLALAMNNTPENVDFNRKTLLQHVTPASFGEMDLAFKERAAELKRLRASTFFVIDQVDMKPEALSVIFEGFRLHYIGQKETLREKKRLVMKLQIIAGRLYLKSLHEVDLRSRATHEETQNNAS